MIWLDEVFSDGIGDNRLYQDFSETKWHEVQDVVDEEDALLRQTIALAADADEFDQLLDREMDERYPGDDSDEGPLSSFALLDVGVMSAVAALSAAGCVTTTSCRGHRVHGEPNPLVRFTTDEVRLPLIQAAARRTGCGLVLDPGGMLQLYARNVLDFVAFARDLLTQRAALDVIETHVAIQRPAEHASDVDADVRRKDLSRLPSNTESISSTHNGTQPTLFNLERPPDQ